MRFVHALGGALGMTGGGRGPSDRGARLLDGLAGWSLGLLSLCGLIRSPAGGAVASPSIGASRFSSAPPSAAGPSKLSRRERQSHRGVTRTPASSAVSWSRWPKERPKEAPCRVLLRVFGASVEESSVAKRATTSPHPQARAYFCGAPAGRSSAIRARRPSRSGANTPAGKLRSWAARAASAAS